MIDTTKVHMMTELAVYEKKEGKRELKMHRYSYKAYMSLKLLESFFLVTLAYLLGSGVYMMRYYTNIMTEGLAFSYGEILADLLLIYGVVVLGSLIVAFFLHKKKYQEMLKHIREYDKKLYKLKKYLEKEEDLSKER